MFIERVPGAFELPLAAKMFAASGRVDAVIALGCVIRGDTPHFDFVAGECARGLMDAGLATGVPVIFGVLTTETQAQAEERADVARMNKGRESMEAALEMIQLLAPPAKRPARKAKKSAPMSRSGRNQPGVDAPRRRAQARHAGAVSLADQRGAVAGRRQRVRDRRRHAQGGSRRTSNSS